jgi:hypothetical protein
LLDPFEHAPVEGGRKRPFDRRRADQRRARPDDADTRRGQQAERHAGCHHVLPIGISAPQRHGAERDQQAGARHRHPLDRRREHEPGRDPPAKPTASHGSAVESGPRERGLGRVGHAGQARALSPRRLLQCSIARFFPQRNRRLAHGHDGIG